MLLNHTDHFEPVDLRKRLFRKVSPTLMISPGPLGGRPEEAGQGASWNQLNGATLSSGPIVQLAVDLAGQLKVANAAAETLFNLRSRDLGRPFSELEVSFRPAELRSRIDQVRTELRSLDLRDVEWLRPGNVEPACYDISVVPLFGTPGELIGVGISFVDVTRYRRVRDELAHTHAELERAYEELQSLNEELETMNEELQSTNDELQVINDELRGRTEELNHVNDFLGCVLRSLGSAVIVLTQDLRVRVWSPGAVELWGLRPEEALSREFLALDIGLPAADFGLWLQQVLSRGRPSSSDVGAVNRRGKAVDLRVAASPMRTDEGNASGLIMVIDQADQAPPDQPIPDQPIPGQPAAG